MPPPHDGIDVDVKFGVLGEELQFLVENLEALFRRVVGLNVVDADLEVLEARFVELPNARRGEKVPVRNQTRNHAVAADAAQ